MRRNEGGIALVLCILALMVLTGIAVGLLYMTDAETSINSNYRSSQQAYFAALAGVQSVRERMTLSNVAPHLITGPTTMPGGAASVMYVVNPASNSDTVTLPIITGTGSYADNELCTELTAQNVGCTQPSTSYALLSEDPPSYGGASTVPAMGQLNYKWVRITAKANAATAPYYANGSASGGGVQPNTQICWDDRFVEVPVTTLGLANCSAGGSGSNPPSQTPVYQLTSLAFTPSGASRMLQMEVAQDPPLTTRGAVDSQDSVNLNGKLTIDGYDYCTCSCTTDNKGVTTCTNRAGQVCDGSKYAIYASGTVDPPKPSETFASGQTPAVVQNQPWPWDLTALVNRFSPGAVAVTGSPYNWSCTGGNCGTQSNVTLGTLPASGPPLSPVSPSDAGYQITYVPGNVQISGSNSQGFGVLVVNGNLDIHGGFTFDGLIIVTGVISFTGGGSTGVNITGGVIAGQQSLVDNTLGGSITINYDFCALPQPDKTKPPRVLALRELNF